MWSAYLFHVTKLALHSKRLPTPGCILPRHENFPLEICSRQTTTKRRVVLFIAHTRFSGVDEGEDDDEDNEYGDNEKYCQMMSMSRMTTRTMTSSY